jgi:hypothetical protein
VVLLLFRLPVYILVGAAFVSPIEAQNLFLARVAVAAIRPFEIPKLEVMKVAEGNVLKYFMWPWQVHFRISASVDAESIFGRLDSRLDPNVFLVGFLQEDRINRHPVCLEPEDCGYTVENFSEVENLAKQMQETDPARRMIHSHPLAHAAHVARIPRRALQNAVQQNLAENATGSSWVSYVSWPVTLEGYWICVVLQLRRHAVERYGTLDRAECDWGTIRRSLIEAVAADFLHWHAEEMRKSEPRGRSFDREAGEFIRAGGRDLMYAPASAGGNFDGLHGLFDAVNAISAMRYEGGDGRGSIVIARQNHPNLKKVVRLSSPVPLRQHRAIRKLLEMTSPETMLLSDSAVVYALGHTTGNYDAGTEDLFVISIPAHHTWELIHSNHVLMRVAYGEPALPKQRIDPTRFSSDLKRIFAGVGELDAEQLWRLTVAAMEQRHGTMLMVTRDAESEANRLRDQCTGIEPIVLDPATLGLVSAIDGAILLSPGGICHAIGLILDGIARPGRGSPARGARYNSAVRYVEGATSNRSPRLAVVVSEDGSVDLVPDLRPQIARKEINARLETLRGIVSTPGDINVAQFNKMMGWLTKHEFYLSPEVCDVVNALRAEIEPRLQEQVNIRIVYQDLEAHPDMNESYFSD